jgi:FOG: TPR repeat, SEL1 subfamily
MVVASLLSVAIAGADDYKNTFYVNKERLGATSFGPYEFGNNKTIAVDGMEWEIQQQNADTFAIKTFVRGVKRTAGPFKFKNKEILKIGEVEYSLILGESEIRALMKAHEKKAEIEREKMQDKRLKIIVRELEKRELRRQTEALATAIEAARKTSNYDAALETLNEAININSQAANRNKARAFATELEQNKKDAEIAKKRQQERERAAEVSRQERERSAEAGRQESAELVARFRKDAEQGDAQAQFSLGVCYDDGINVRKDSAEAVKWYRKAAEQGHVDAQFFLGSCYFIGNGVRMDYAEAVKWFRKAADQGSADARNALRRLDKFTN